MSADSSTKFLSREDMLCYKLQIRNPGKVKSN